MITKDIFFAAYLLDQDIKLKSFNKDGRIIEFEFNTESFIDSNLRVNFLNSDYMKMKQQIEKLKGLSK